MTASPSTIAPAEKALAQKLAEALAPMGFATKELGTPLEEGVLLGAWVRKTWNTNRAVVHLHAPPSTKDLGLLTQQLKLPLGKELGYFPFFYGMGLQVVWSGRGLTHRAASLSSSVDVIDNQRCIVQSLFVVDLDRGTFREARTWGQVITGTFQDRIAECLQRDYQPET
ncbi:hypothetical protein [Hyalangium rubrum]|uniref:Uncharacterized protein n=1 Tax=Hyalangium rubrum TaxID=3103134 RepID=A0ABU5H5B9_9BACT|nr:hypothetical protein [Hyalangium sp. s54d21]MDY7228525.1 hypothetical protein [Hyalangium sp. s54d21]